MPIALLMLARRPQVQRMPPISVEALPCTTLFTQIAVIQYCIACSGTQMEECLAYIKEMMGDKDSDVGKVVTGFPEVIALGVDDGPPGLKYAVEFIESEWYMDAKARRMTTARKPKILGCRVDCRGNCAGMCHWCWATA